MVKGVYKNRYQSELENLFIVVAKENHFLKWAVEQYIQFRHQSPA